MPLKQAPVIYNKKIYFCICHQKPLFDLPNYINLIQTAEFESKLNRFSVSEYLVLLGIKPLTSYLFDYAALLIYDIIESVQDEVDVVVTLLHRKVCLTRPAGVPAINLLHSWQAPAESLDIDHELQLHNGDLLFAHPQVYSQSIANMYAYSHIIQDFLRLSAICIDAGLWSQQNLFDMLTSRILFWCPGIGALPIAGALDMFRAAADYILTVHESGFVCKYPDHPYQKRAISFFAERLLSQRLISWLEKAGRISVHGKDNITIPKSYIGYLCNCTEGSEITNFQSVGLY